MRITPKDICDFMNYFHYSIKSTACFISDTFVIFTDIQLEKLIKRWIDNCFVDAKE